MGLLNLLKQRNSYGTMGLFRIWKMVSLSHFRKSTCNLRFGPDFLISSPVKILICSKTNKNNFVNHAIIFLTRFGNKINDINSSSYR